MPASHHPDSTDAHRSVEKSRADQLRYQHLASLSSEGLLIHRGGIILDANLAFAKLIGISDPDALIGQNVLEIMPLTPESRQCVIALLPSPGSNKHEIEFETSDGTVIPAEVSCKDITYRGDICRLVTLNDISSRKQTELQLKRQLERLNVLHTLDQAVASVMDLDEILKLFVRLIVEQIQVDACSILLLNPRTQTLDFAAKQGFLTRALEFTRLRLGIGLAGRAAQDRRVIFIPDLAEITNNATLTLAIAQENFVMYIGIPLIVKDNLLGVLEIFHRSRFAADLDWIKFLEILANEAAIVIDNARLLGIAQQSYVETSSLYQINKKLIATVDPQELMDEVVNLLQSNFGYHYVQIFVADPKTGDIVMRAGTGELGKRLKSEGYKLSPGDGIVGSTAETGKPFFTNSVEDVITFIRPPYLVDTKSELAVPIKTGDRFLGLLDIHQKAPNALSERDVQLVTAVADQLAVALQKASLYSDLQQALDQEQATRSMLIHNEKLAMAGRLLASVSHELNNPIQAIQNALFLLKNEQGISAQGKQDLEIVLSETERMASLLARLRNTYRRVNADDFKQVDLNEIIREMAVLVATHLRQHQVTLELGLDLALPCVLGLEDQLRQVMLNLVMNSVEAMPQGGHLTIHSQFLAESREARISVADTGIGIKEEIIPIIFEAFFTDKERGTGLGLTISQEIILRHNGRIQAENNVQQGAVIHIWLPVVEDVGGK